MTDAVKRPNSMEPCRFCQDLPTAAIVEATLVAHSSTFHYESSVRGRHPFGMVASEGATETWGARPGMSAVKTTPIGKS